jgi:lysophospholipase L1-like esterase
VADRSRSVGIALLVLALTTLVFGAGLLSATTSGRGAPAGEDAEADALADAVGIEDPSGHALDAFRAALDRARRREGRARVLWWGASHTAADEYVGMIRDALQQRYGDAGPGFVIPVKPFRGWDHRVAHARSGGAWRVLRGDRGPVGEAYGYAGYAVESLQGGAWGVIEAPHVGSFDVLFLHQPGGGRFEVRIDGTPAAVVDTDGELRGGHARFRVRDGGHSIGLRALDREPVRLFGVVMERDRSGVVVDTLGIPGSRARAHLRWDDALYREQIRRRRPDLVVLAYGTNESEDVNVPIRRYESDLRRVVRRLRRAAPQASCLLVGPSDRPIRGDDGTLAARPLTDRIVEVQRRVAADEGCGFFDLALFMGGPLSMAEWVAHDPPLGREDYVHFTEDGHARLAEVLGEALIDRY